MVTAVVTLSGAQSLLRPVGLRPSCFSQSNSRSRLRHLPSLSSNLLQKDSCHYHVSSNSRVDFSRPSYLYFRHRLKPVAALGSDGPEPIQPGVEALKTSEKDENFKQWDWWTAKFAAGANLPFLLLQLPQILLNARNLAAGNNAALLAISWLGILTGLLGNLSLLSYFAKKKETEAMIVQCLGVITTYVVITQLAMAQAMPFEYFVSVSIVVGTGVISNFLNYFGMLPPVIWRLWEDFITIGGLSVLPQVMWSTFVPYIPNSVLPGAICFVAAVVAVVMARLGKLSEEGVRFVGAISGWTATLLFMWMPVAQMWTNFLNPDNIKGLSAVSMLLAMIGNGLMIPRSLFIRDLMWFTGSMWSSFLYGWGNLLCMYMFNTITREFFLAATAGYCAWIGITFWKDSRAYGFTSPLRSLKELLLGS